MEEIPTPFELALLTATLVACPRADQSVQTHEETMAEALQIFRLAEKRVAKLRDSFAANQELVAIRERLKEAPRLLFEPYKETDEVREYLQADDPGEIAGGLPNLRRGSTVEAKLRTFFVDKAIVMDSHPDFVSGNIDVFFSEKSLNAQNQPSYALLKSRLFEFKCWQREWRRLEALFRKQRVNGNVPSITEVRARLASAATGNSKSAHEFEQIFSLEATREAAFGNVARNILTKLRPSNTRKERTE